MENEEKSGVVAASGASLGATFAAGDAKYTAKTQDLEEGKDPTVLEPSNNGRRKLLILGFIGILIALVVAVVVLSVTVDEIGEIFGAGGSESTSATNSPTKNPTLNPTQSPTISPTVNPTAGPTKLPTFLPTESPTFLPTFSPTTPLPTLSPTTATPTFNPTTSQPTFSPTVNPTNSPTTSPTKNPTFLPTVNPTLLPTTSPSPNPTVLPSFSPTVFSDEDPLFEDLVLFPKETRRGNDFIGLMFTDTPSNLGFDAFIRATIRWSDILVGSEASLVERDVKNACGQTFRRAVTTDHLRIFVTEIFIDGPTGLIGQAGPCDVNIGELPVFGNFIIDTANVPVLASSDILDIFLIHEIGHILGIGTLWSSFNLEINPLPGNVANPALPQPFYVGTNGVAQFSLVKGSSQSQIAIENGLDGNGNPQGIGPGQIGTHWDKDELGNELMTFSIASNSALSIVSIGSLIDLNYVVDLTLADAFADPFPARSRTNEEPIMLGNDIILD